MGEIGGDVALVLLGAVLSGTGFLVKRWIEHKDGTVVAQFVDNHERLMRVHATSTTAIAEPDRALLERATESNYPRLALATVDPDADVPRTQTEITVRAGHQRELAELRMNDIFRELLERLNGAGQAVLEESQKAWEEHADLQAHLAAHPFRDGSIFSTIYSGERTLLAEERQAALQRSLDAYSF